MEVGVRSTGRERASEIATLGGRARWESVPRLSIEDPACRFLADSAAGFVVRTPLLEEEWDASGEALFAD